MTVRISDRRYSQGALIPQSAGHPDAPVTDAFVTAMQNAAFYAQNAASLISMSPGSLALNTYSHYQEVGVVRGQIMTSASVWGGISRAWWRMHEESARVRATAIVSVSAKADAQVDLRLRLVRGATEVNGTVTQEISNNTSFTGGTGVTLPWPGRDDDGLHRRTNGSNPSIWDFQRLSNLPTTTIDVEVALGAAYSANAMLEIRLEARCNRLDDSGSYATPAMLRIHHVVFQSVYQDDDFTTELSESGGATTLSPMAFAYGNPILYEDINRLLNFMQWAYESRFTTFFSLSVGEAGWDDYGGASSNAAAIWDLSGAGSSNVLRTHIWISTETSTVEAGAECDLVAGSTTVTFTLTGSAGSTAIVVTCTNADNGTEVASTNNDITSIVSGAEWVLVVVTRAGAGLRQIRLAEDEILGGTPTDD